MRGRAHPGIVDGVNTRHVVDHPRRRAGRHAGRAGDHPAGVRPVRAGDPARSSTPPTSRTCWCSAAATGTRRCWWPWPATTSSAASASTATPAGPASAGRPTGRSSGPSPSIPCARAGGVGRQLVEECIRRATSWRAAAIGLHTATFMMAAVRLYERRGFTRVPHLDVDPTTILDVDGVDAAAGRHRLRAGPRPLTPARSWAGSSPAAGGDPAHVVQWRDPAQNRRYGRATSASRPSSRSR